MLNRTTTPIVPGPLGTTDTARASAQARTRFMALVQSPLRSGLLRYLGARPHDAYDVESLMQTFGRIRMDVANCLRALVNAGLAPDVHVVVTDLGVEKAHNFDVTRDQVAEVAGTVAAALEELGVTSAGGGCGCGS